MAELAQNQENLQLVTAEFDKLEEGQYHAQKILEKAITEKETLTGIVRDAEEKLKNYREQAFSSMQTLVMTRNKLSSLRQEQDRLHRQQETLKEKVTEAETALEETRRSLSGEQEALNGLADRRQRLEEKAAKASASLEQSVHEYRELAARLQQQQRTQNQKKPGCRCFLPWNGSTKVSAKGYAAY